MRTRSFLPVIVMFVLLSACGPSASDIETAIAQTEAARPTVTFTPAPTETATPLPTATVVPLPDVVGQTFSGASVIWHDTFEYKMEGLVPQGWQTDEDYAIWVTKDGQLKAHPADHGDWSGTVFYFPKQKIVPNTGVYFAFEYKGTKENFTLGMDSVQDNGERAQQGNQDFFSVSMLVDLDRDNVSVSPTKRGSFQGGQPLQGNLKLQENTWYGYLLGYDDQGNYVLKIWSLNDTGRQLTYFQKFDEFPDAYYFISWVTSKHNILMDDFTIFGFEKILQE